LAVFNIPTGLYNDIKPVETIKKSQKTLVN